MDPVTRVDLTLPHGITLVCRARGAADAPRRVLLLHGFPEAAFIWDEVTARLGPDVRSLAPNLRGFGESSAPTELSAYRAKHLVADIAALIDMLGAPIDLLVAHDWGGALAWGLAALQPQKLERLLIINSPHPAAFQRELLHSAAQREASAYMNELVRPDAAARLAAHDFAGLWATFERFGPAPWLTPELRARYRTVWSRGLDGALNYYRASPLRPPKHAHDDALAKLALPDSVVRVEVPTTVLWGERDHALLPGLLDGLERWVPNLQTVRIPEASHWIVHEQPALVADLIGAQLAAAHRRP